MQNNISFSFSKIFPIFSYYSPWGLREIPVPYRNAVLIFYLLKMRALVMSFWTRDQQGTQKAFQMPST